ncbi:hypothetical protein AB0383_48430 [Amycolatopsis sp. NPDC051373]|uniref:hypothetical protein n=1 Tax=Amycolatopsis sp. NPDC051373 TaxID=3155801 RepID=UPI00344B91E2
MTSQSINNHNKIRYAEFEFALDQVRNAFDDVSRMVKKLDDHGTSGNRFEGWQVPSKEDVQVCVRAASTGLDLLRESATKRKAELISRGWRV